MWLPGTKLYAVMRQCERFLKNYRKLCWFEENGYTIGINPEMHGFVATSHKDRQILGHIPPDKSHASKGTQRSQGSDGTS